MARPGSTRENCEMYLRKVLNDEGVRCLDELIDYKIEEALTKIKKVD